MAKFVSDLKTQLPADKVLVTDENSVVKTSDVTKQQFQDLIDDSIIVDKYSDLPSIAKDGANGFVKNDELISTPISEFTKGMLTNIYVVPNPSLEGITLPELGERTVYVEALPTEDYAPQFIYGNVAGKFSDAKIILVWTRSLNDSGMCYIYNLSPSTISVSLGSTLDIGWYKCDRSFTKFELIENYSEIPYVLNIELPNVQGADSYIAYENSILCKFLASSVQNNVKGHYKYENENWVYNEEELTVDTYNQLPTNNIKENQLAFVKNSTSGEYIEKKSNTEPFKMEDNYTSMEFVRYPDLSSETSEGFVGTLSTSYTSPNPNAVSASTLHRSMVYSDINAVGAASGDHPGTGFWFYCFIDDNNIHQFCADKYYQGSSYIYAGKDGSGNSIHTYTSYCYVDSDCKSIYYTTEAVEVTLSKGWNKVVITRTRVYDSDSGSYINTFTLESESVSYDDFMSDVNSTIGSDFKIVQINNYEAVEEAADTDFNKFILLNSTAKYYNSKGHYIYTEGKWKCKEDCIYVNNYDELPTYIDEYTASNNLNAYVTNEISKVTTRYEINENPFSIDTVYSDFQFVETPDLSSVETKDPDSKYSFDGYVGTLNLDNMYFNNGFTFSTRALSGADSNSVNAFVVQRFTYDSSCSYGAYPYVKDGNNKTYEYYIYVDSNCNLYIDDIEKDSYSIDAMQLSAGWNHVIITINTAENTSSVSSNSISHKDMMTNIKAVTTDKFYITEVEILLMSPDTNKIKDNTVSYYDNGGGSACRALYTAGNTTFNKYIQLIYKDRYYKPAGHYNYVDGQWISSAIKNKTTSVLSLNDYTELPINAEEGQAAYLAKSRIKVIDDDISSTAKISADEYTSIYLPETLSINISEIPTGSGNTYSESMWINSENGLYNLLFQYDKSNGPILGIMNPNTYRGNMYLFEETYSEIVPNSTPGWYDYATAKYIEDITKLIQPGISYITSYSSSSTDETKTIQDSIILKLLAKEINLYKSGHYVYLNNNWIYEDNIINQQISPTVNSLFLAPILVHGSNVNADDICIFTLMKNSDGSETKDTAAVTSYNIPILVSSLLSTVTSWEDYEQFDENIKRRFSSNRWLVPTSQLVKFRGPGSERERIQSLSIDFGTAGNVILMFNEAISWESLRSDYNIQDPEFAAGDEGAKIPNGAAPELTLVDTIIVHDSRNGVSYSIDYTTSGDLFTPEYTILHNTPILEAQIGNIDTILTRLNSGEGV